jgi:hypothetical protein
METELRLSVGGFPPLSARGCVQELTPIQTGEFRRTINGALIFLGTKETKYKSVVWCKDKNVIATHSLYPGQVIQMNCIQRLWQKIEGQTLIKLEKKAVEGSILLTKGQSEFVTFDLVEEGIRPHAQADYVCYQPILSMMIKSYQLECNEWGMSNGWRLESEET